MKLLSLLILLLSVSSCFVSKKKYISLEQEIIQLKSGLKDDDKDGVPNYVDLEPKTDSLANVDSKGRTLIVEKIVDIDGDGVLDVDDFCPTIKGVSAANGCPDKDGDGVYDFEDKCLNVAGLKEENGCPIVKPHRHSCIPFSITFLPQSLKFDSLSKIEIDNYLNTLIKILDENKDTIALKITGHTDNSQDSLKSLKLSVKRAELIKAKLVKKGVKKELLIVEGHGKEQPRVSNQSEKGRKLNNRVEIILVRIEQ